MTQLDPDDGTADDYEDEEDYDVPEWTDQVMATVAAEVRRRRKERDMSAQELADACAEIGHPIPRNVIANMESGRRSILPLVDVIVLAEALGTHPALLIFPLGHISQVQRLPLQDAVSPWEAMSWFDGDSGYGMDGALVRAFREYQRHEATTFDAWNDMRNRDNDAQSATDPKKRAHARQAAERAIARLETATAHSNASRERIRRILGPSGQLPRDLRSLTSDTLNRTDSI
ncbi:helix-turn-helix transcriptional regulator [Streptomyces sp. NPDC051976]|uniref:helix-turn-helix domain-containing protein n=1 Tax=Streptomyces sp. NPDC051976 TaxID=3154947 RepID=UPI00343A00BD